MAGADHEIRGRGDVGDTQGAARGSRCCDPRDPLQRVGVIDVDDPKLAKYAKVVEEHPELFDIATRASRSKRATRSS